MYGEVGRGKRNVCLFMCSCMHVQRLEEDVGALLNHLLPQNRVSHRNWSLPFSARLAGFSSIPPVPGLLVCMDMTGFYVGPGDVNPGPDACTANALKY